MSAYPEKYLFGIELFNQGRYYECHDEWEEIWLEAGPPKDNFLKGLIQAAIALYHLESGNLAAALTLYEGQRKYLLPYKPSMMGMEIEPFLEQMDRAFALAKEKKQDVKLDPELAPKIVLSP